MTSLESDMFQLPCIYVCVSPYILPCTYAEWFNTGPFAYLERHAVPEVPRCWGYFVTYQRRLRAHVTAVTLTACSLYLERQDDTYSLCSLTFFLPVTCNPNISQPAQILTVSTVGSRFIHLTTASQQYFNVHHRKGKSPIWPMC